MNINLSLLKKELKEETVNDLEKAISKLKSSLNHNSNSYTNLIHLEVRKNNLSKKLFLAEYDSQETNLERNKIVKHFLGIIDNLKVGELKSIKGKILIVDDEVEIRKWVKIILEEEGYIITEAENGLDCLYEMKKEKFNCILMDIKMPKMDGIETLRKIRIENLDETPIIIITAHGERKEIAESFKLGANEYIGKELDFINKPFDFKKLIVVVDDVINNKKEKGRKKWEPQSVDDSTTKKESERLRIKIFELTEKNSRLDTRNSFLINSIGKKWDENIQLLRTTFTESAEKSIKSKNHLFYAITILLFFIALYFITKEYFIHSQLEIWGKSLSLSIAFVTICASIYFYTAYHIHKKLAAYFNKKLTNASQDRINSLINIIAGNNKIYHEILDNDFLFNIYNSNQFPTAIKSKSLIENMKKRILDFEKANNNK